VQTRQLEYFVAVAEELSFTRAAKRFFVSQAALSQQIRLLEREVGARLFERDSHHVELTPAGRSFLDDARRMLCLEHESVIRAQRTSKGISGTLSIGYVKGYEHTNLCDMVRSFRMDNPHVKISFLRENVAELYDAVKAETIDVAINLLYSPSEMEGIEFQVLRHWPLIAVVPAGHPLAGKASVKFSELEGYELVDIDRGGSQYGENLKINATFEEEGFSPKISYVSQDVATTTLAVASGMGYALLPGYFTGPFLTNDKVRAIPIEGREDEMCVAASWLPSHRNEALDIFLDNYLQVG
jgi:LysR family transcriptional activator of glutamate synthase operon